MSSHVWRLVYQSLRRVNRRVPREGRACQYNDTLIVAMYLWGCSTIVRCVGPPIVRIIQVCFGHGSCPPARSLADESGRLVVKRCWMH